MSLLMKALEKSEKERKEAGASKVEAAGSGTGFKLAAGVGGQRSKLGSALAGVLKKEGEKEQAKRVVAAYDNSAVEAEEAAMVRESAKARNRLFLGAAFGVVVLGGLYYGYENYLRDIIFGPDGTTATGQVVATATGSGQDSSRDSSQDSSQDSEPVFDNISLLPIAEPNYDIQENVLAAVLGAGPDAQSRQGEEISGQIRNFAQQLLAESVSEAGRTAKLLEEVSRQSALLGTEELALVFDPETATTINYDDYMLARLEELDKPVLADKAVIASAGKYNTRTRELLQPQPVALNTPASDSSQLVAPSRKLAKVEIKKIDNQLKALMESAVASYASGDFNAAETGFRSVLASEPRNIGAMIGLSKVHSSRGNTKLAVATLLKASDLDPRNAKVVIELIALQSGSANPILSERRILALLGVSQSRQNDSRLTFTLGTLYAQQERWLEARESFARAYRLDSSNPDFAYNLAVVMDYLNDPEDAVQMYQRAATLAQRNVSSFDAQIAIDRAATLRSGLGQQ